MHIDSGRRYVGLTSQTTEKRWSQHVNKSKFSKGGRWHFPNAIRKYGKDAFSHEILEICDSLEEANAAEDKWISYFDTRDPLFGFNLSKGGKHTPHPIKNPWDRPEYRVKACLAAKNKWDEPGYRAKACLAAKNKWDEPGYRAKSCLASKNKWENLEFRAKVSASVKNRWEDPEFIERRVEVHATLAKKYLMRTSILCKKHGEVNIIDCYCRKSRSGNMSRLVCKQCVKECNKNRYL